MSRGHLPTGPAPRVNSFVDCATPEALDQLVVRYGHREAVVCDGERLTFAELRDNTRATAAGLRAHGVGPGDRVGLWLTNRPEFVELVLALGHLGAIAVLLNTRLTESEVEYQLTNAGASMLVTSASAARGRDFLADALRVADRTPAGVLESILTLGRATVGDPRVQPLTRGRAEDFVGPRVDAETPWVIIYTSGSTAAPKGAVLSHQLWRKAFDGAERFGLTEDDRLLLCVPLFGILGLLNGALTWLSHGAALVIHDGFDARRCWATIEAERCSALHVIPAMIEPLLEEYRSRPVDRSRLRTGVILSTDPAAIRRTATEVGIPEIIASYGMTETTGVVARPWHYQPLEVRALSQGSPLPGVQIRIVDDRDQELRGGQIGQIEVHGYCTMKGYFNAPGATAAALRPDGWLRTGDLGRFDDEGNIHFVGRLADTYKWKGYNVACAEVEKAISEHPDLAEAVVVGVPEPEAGAVGVAFVRARPGRSLDLAGIVADAATRLADFKLPAAVVAVEDFPRAAGTGKVLKKPLKDAGAAVVRGERPEDPALTVLDTYTGRAASPRKR